MSFFLAHSLDALHKKFFWGSSGVLIGIALASLGFGVTAFPFILVLFIVPLVCYFFSKKKGFLFFPFVASFIFCGAFYSGFFDIQNSKINIPFSDAVTIQGIVSKSPAFSEKKQEIAVKLSEPYRGNILIQTARFPVFKYGDKVEFTGEIKQIPENGYGNYLIKEGMYGILSFPEIILISHNNGSFIKSALFKIKGKVELAINAILPYKSAAFLKGILLGNTNDFSSEFDEAMKKSGTTHLVALSGYNITILILAVASLFTLFMTPRGSFFASLFSIAGFSIMTGGEPSVARAGIMGASILFGRLFGSGESMKNVILLSALIMSLYNPRILIFDIGFQLSFLALLGIVYLKPKIELFLNTNGDKGIFSWKENLLTTVSAQITVLPILLSKFGFVSLASLPANIVLLSLTPFTMALGFVSVFVELSLPFLSIISGVVLGFLLQCEIGIIEFFGKISGGVSLNFSTPAVLLYYTALIIFYGIARTILRKKKTSEYFFLNNGNMPRV